MHILKAMIVLHDIFTLCVRKNMCNKTSVIKSLCEVLLSMIFEN